MKNIQISEELFLRLIEYHLVDETDRGDEIEKALATKLDAVVGRKYYTAYKTADTPKEREQALQKYLNQKGCRESSR